MQAARGSERSLSATLSRYLEAAHYIAHEGEQVRPSRLAEWLGVSAPTVTQVVQRLREQGLIEAGNEHGLVLTAEGEAEARSIVRRHRIVERWLTDSMGLDWATADLEAGRMAHFVSELVLGRLFESLGRPTTCPHGNEIPGAGLRRRPLLNLAELPEGRTATISRISEVAEHEAPQLLRLLDSEGLKPGVEIQVRRSPGSDALTVQLGERLIALGMPAARSVWVEVSAEGNAAPEPAAP